MRRIHGKHRFDLHTRPFLFNIEFDWLDAPPEYSGQVLGDVLTGARADFQDRVAIAEDALQDREDGFAVALAGFGERR